MRGAITDNASRADDPRGQHHALWIQMSTIGAAAAETIALAEGLDLDPGLFFQAAQARLTLR